MYAVTHAVEAFPREAYAETLAKVCADMARSNPCFLKFLLQRIVRNGSYFTDFLQAAKSGTRSSKECLHSLLNQMKDNPKET